MYFTPNKCLLTLFQYACSNNIGLEVKQSHLRAITPIAPSLLLQAMLPLWSMAQNMAKSANLATSPFSASTR